MREKGFTLAELVITVALAAIVLALAVPAFREMMQNNRAVTQANELVTALNLARSEAVKRNREVRLSAVDAGDGANEWGGGWRVWFDADGDGRLDSGEALREHPALPGGTILDSVENVSELRYRGSGDVANLAPGAVFRFTLRQPGCSGLNARDITVRQTGSVTVEKVSCD